MTSRTSKSKRIVPSKKEEAIALEHIVESLRSLAVPCDSLDVDPANCRLHNEANLSALRGSLRAYGQVKAIVVNRRTGIVEAGNGTLMAARQLGWTHIAVVYVDHDPATAAGFSIADNRAAELATWDEDALKLLLPELDRECDELAAMIEAMEAERGGVEEPTPGLTDPDAVPEAPDEPVTRTGDLWLLGDQHRLLCGDSTDAGSVALLMGGEKADLCIADPPYGINASSMTMGSAQSSKPKEQRLSNGQTWDCVRPDISQIIQSARFVCVWGGNYFADVLPPSNDWLCWHKKNDGLSFSEFELAWTNYGRNCRHISHHWGAEKKAHITQKPVAVIVSAIQFSPCEDSASIYDPFLGSGTTIIAAQQLNRRCFGVEISPAYCDVALRRWADFTGLDPIRESDGASFSELAKDGSVHANS